MASQDILSDNEKAFRFVDSKMNEMSNERLLKYSKNFDLEFYVAPHENIKSLVRKINDLETDYGFNLLIREITECSIDRVKAQPSSGPILVIRSKDCNETYVIDDFRSWDGKNNGGKV